MRNLSSRKRSTGVADGAHQTSPQILAPANEIEHLAGFRIEHQPVDREIAPANILFRRLRILDAVGMAAIGIADVGAKRRHLDLRLSALSRLPVGLALRRTFRHRLSSPLDNEDDAEAGANRDVARKQLLHAFRSRVSSHVIVGRLAPEQ